MTLDPFVFCFASIRPQSVRHFPNGNQFLFVIIYDLQRLRQRPVVSFWVMISMLSNQSQSHKIKQLFKVHWSSVILLLSKLRHSVTALLILVEWVHTTKERELIAVLYFCYSDVRHAINGTVNPRIRRATESGVPRNFLAHSTSHLSICGWIYLVSMCDTYHLKNHSTDATASCLSSKFLLFYFAAIYCRKLESVFYTYYVLSILHNVYCTDGWNASNILYDKHVLLSS